MCGYSHVEQEVSAGHMTHRRLINDRINTNIKLCHEKPGFIALYYHVPSSSPPTHLPPLSAGQDVSVEHPPQHASRDGGVDPQQPEAMVVMFDLVYNPLPDCSSDRISIQRGAVNRAPLLQLLLLL